MAEGINNMFLTIKNHASRQTTSCFEQTMLSHCRDDVKNLEDHLDLYTKGEVIAKWDSADSSCWKGTDVLNFAQSFCKVATAL